MVDFWNRSIGRWRTYATGLGNFPYPSYHVASLYFYDVNDRVLKPSTRSALIVNDLIFTLTTIVINKRSSKWKLS